MAKKNKKTKFHKTYAELIRTCASFVSACVGVTTLIVVVLK